MRVKITFKYDGSCFNGFQRLNNQKSVQKGIENALELLLKKKIEIKGAGRTDAGVHANNQVAHFDIDNKVNNLKTEMNRILLPDIYIKKLEYVSDDFHARRSVKKKEYVYKINLGPFQCANNNYFYQPNFKLDISLMKEASKALIGYHDFHNFTSGEREDYHTTIYNISFNKIGNKLEIHFIGTSFYRYMVRNLVGALIEVGKCKESFDVLEKMLDTDVNKVLPTAPACGLYLNKIWY